MKTLLTLLTCLFLLSPNVVLSETVKYEDLVERNGLFYKKSSDVPFSGKVTGKRKGLLHHGKKEGPWVVYWDNGQEHFKTEYRDGKKHGLDFGYHRNGHLSSFGNYTNDKQDGPWVVFWKDDRLWMKGEYKHGKQEGPWVVYWSNGQLGSRGQYKNGRLEGPWINFKRDGSIMKKWTGTFKDGEKVSD
jgi:antitoxin component YwqK of YwqJK toxin-antitoxin module